MYSDKLLLSSTRRQLAIGNKKITCTKRGNHPQNRCNKHQLTQGGRASKADNTHPLYQARIVLLKIALLQRTTVSALHCIYLSCAEWHTCLPKLPCGNAPSIISAASVLVIQVIFPQHRQRYSLKPFLLKALKPQPRPFPNLLFRLTVLSKELWPLNDWSEAPSAAKLGVIGMLHLYQPQNCCREAVTLAASLSL